MSTPREALFLDATGRGFTRNLAAVRDLLLRERPNVPPRYFFADMDADAATKGERRAMDRMLRTATERAGWVITASESPHARLGRGAADQRRVLLLAPRLGLVDDSAAPEEPVAGYTDVIVPGRAFTDTAESRFPGARVQALGLPVFAELVSESLRARARSQLLTLCPHAERKRIVVITTQRRPEQVFGVATVAELAERLPDDVFLVVDLPIMLKTLEHAPSRLAERVFVNDGAFGIFSLLALADELLTSKFRDAVYFSVTGRALRFLNSEKNVGTLGDKLPSEARLECAVATGLLSECRGDGRGDCPAQRTHARPGKRRVRGKCRLERCGARAQGGILSDGAGKRSDNVVTARRERHLSPSPDSIAHPAESTMHQMRPLRKGRRRPN